MDVPERVEAYLASRAEPKQTDLRQLHAQMLAEFPDATLWFNDGTNEDGKVVANPNIGYGEYTITYGALIGRATITGYCIKFRRLSVVNADALQAAIRHGMNVDRTG